MKNERGEKRLNKNRIRNKFVSILISSDVLEMRELQKKSSVAKDAAGIYSGRRLYQYNEDDFRFQF